MRCLRYCAVIQHVLFEDLGNFARVLGDAGFSVTYYHAGVNLPTRAEWLSADLAVVLGGPIGVSDTEEYPFLSDEVALVASRIDAGLPLIGICLGAQIIADALGAVVYPGKRKEIGWAPVTLTGPGRSSSLRHLEGVSVLHWHGDTFDLPADATLLASTELTPHQAFSIGKTTLALQFHPEAEPRYMERWLIGHTCELGVAGVSPSVIRASAASIEAGIAAASRKMLLEWLADVFGGGDENTSYLSGDPGDNVLPAD